MTTTALHQDRAGVRQFAVRRPATAFVIVVLSLGLPLLTLAAALEIPQEPFVLVTAYLGLTGAALLITRWADGPGAVRELLGRLVKWRFGVSRWLIVVLAMPLASIGVGAATGTLQPAPNGWAWEIGVYLFSVFIFGALMLNLWEELGWTGFLQARLMQRHGLLIGALLTAIPYAALHLPRAFTPGWTWSSAALIIALMALSAPFFRYLMGMVYLDTAGSLLAAGLMHAAFNASGALEILYGGWQYIPAMIVLTVVMGLWRRYTSRSR